MSKDKIAYLYQKSEIDPAAVLKMKKSVALFTQHQIWYPSHHEPGKEPLELPKRKRVVRSLVINPEHFLQDDGLIEIYVPGFGMDRNGSLQPIATVEFEDGELRLSWITEDGAYEESTLPRDEFLKRRRGRAIPTEES